MSEEIWKPIPGFERYEISNHGRLRALYFKNGLTEKKYDDPKLRKPSPCDRGYYRTALCKDGKQYNKSIHSLVAEAFLGPRPEGYHCAHLDGNPSNNHVSNLMWCTPKENHSHKKIHGTSAIGERQGSAKLTNEQALYIKQNYRRESYLKSNSKELAKMFNVNVGTIWMIVRGHIWKEAIEKQALAEFGRSGGEGD